MPWPLIIPGVVEIAKEIIALFKSKKSNAKRQAAAREAIKARFPVIKDHQANIVIELVVLAQKQGYDEARTNAFVTAILSSIDGWSPEAHG